MPKHAGSANNWTGCEGYPKKNPSLPRMKPKSKKRKEIWSFTQIYKNWKLWFDQLLLRLAWAHEVCQLSHLINSQILGCVVRFTTHIICQNKHRLMWSLYKHSSSTESKTFWWFTAKSDVTVVGEWVSHKWLVIPSSCRSPFGLTVMCF